MDTIALEPCFVEALRLSPDAARRLHGTLPGERHDWVPPWAAADLARQAGAACWRALGSALACIYAAAHLADDLADRDATPSQWTEGTLTVVELLTAGRQGVAQLDLDRGNTNPWAVADLASRTHLTTETGAFYPLAQFKLSPTITTFPFPLGLMVSENHSHSLFRWVGLSSFWFC